MQHLIAVDIGNARIKLGVFAPGANGHALPRPRQTLALAGRRPDSSTIFAWLADAAIDAEPLAWWIGSVNRPAATGLVDWIRQHRPDDSIRLLASGDLAIEVQLERPDMVGVDRLIDALAANQLRAPGRAAIVVDVGTAITVDLITNDGLFRGGAILPGIGMAARAMHTFTDLLPLIDMAELASPPPAVGTSTVPAMQSGLFWGAVGAIRELVARMADPTDRTEPQIFLTGGAGPAVVELLGPSASHVPHLTLGGIALAWLTAQQTL